jgi:hypothetical protein
VGTCAATTTATTATATIAPTSAYIDRCMDAPLRQHKVPPDASNVEVRRSLAAATQGAGRTKRGWTVYWTMIVPFMKLWMAQ